LRWIKTSRAGNVPVHNTENKSVFSVSLPASNKAGTGGSLSLKRADRTARRRILRHLRTPEYTPILPSYLPSLAAPLDLSP